MSSKSQQVKSWFESPGKYLSNRQFDIRIRIETVQQFTKGLTFGRVLDIGCGDGSISMPLLSRCEKLTLLDISNNMLAIAKGRIPAERASDVEVINAPLLESNLEPESFDLVLCIGVLAHVDSPAAVVAEIARISKPGACVILEFTDSFHFWNVPTFMYYGILRLFRSSTWALNRLKNADITEGCRMKGLSPVALYRYGLPPAGSHKIVGQDEMYRMTRYLFGASDQNRNAWMGNEYIYCLEKNRVIAAD
jgi:ubiquinone/menaquinone biosynthesis C-methylase UbiE